VKVKIKTVVFKNKMQRGKYELLAGSGKLDSSFTPALSPKEMLSLGVFEGLYLNSCVDEYPSSWFSGAKLSASPDPSVNLFGVKSRSSLSDWKSKGWIMSDPRGWFEWYCRYYLGRRIEDDTKQISRHRSFVRHSAQVLKYGNRDISIRPKQRQALLQWSYDPFPDFKTKNGESVYQKTKRIIDKERQK
jgi:hypothetical protein